MGSIVVVLMLLVVLVASVAYVVVGALETKASPPGILTYEGVITERVDCVDGGTRLWLRVDGDDTILEISVYDAAMPAGLRAGQRVRVQGRIGEVSDVGGAFVDLREPPQHRRVLCATDIHREPEPAQDNDLWQVRVLLLSVSGAFQTIRLVHFRLYGVLFGMVLALVCIAYIAWRRRRAT